MTKKYSVDDIKIIKQDPELWASVDISRKGFASNLESSVCEARDFTRQYVTNHLPDAMRYLVCLGCSYDEAKLQENERCFPEDYAERERFAESCEEILNLLWRNGAVPEWINVMVYDADDKFTYIKLICCGRFSSEKSYMYHANEGRAPFHVLGPDLPPEHFLNGDTKKFNLHWRQNA